jgi:hypothetical protein
MAYKTFVNGYALTASELNSYLMNQSVMVFADSTARSAALTSPTAGMVTFLTGTSSLELYNGSTWAAITGAGTNLNRPIITSAHETTTVSAIAATGTINYDADTQGDLVYTTNATGNFVLNVRASAAVTLNTRLAVGESQSIVFRNTNGATAYYMTSLTIDGTTQTVKWLNAAPTAGNASALDVYSFVITKTATNTYIVLGSLAKFA